MTTENQIDSIIESLVNDVTNGITLKGVRKSLSNKNVPTEMADKITRIVEIRSNREGY